MEQMQQPVAVGLDSPLCEAILLSVLGLDATVTIASSSGRTRSVGQLARTETGGWFLCLAEPYEGAPPVSVHLRVESCAVALEAPVLSVAGPAALCLGLPNWLECREKRWSVASSLALTARYSVGKSLEWHSGLVVGISRRTLLLQGPVMVPPGAVCEVRIALESSPLPLSLRACCEGAVSQEGRNLMSLQLRGISVQAEQLLHQACALSAQGEQVMVWR